MANGRVGLIGLRAKLADLYFHKKKKLNVNFLEIMNQINQRNELYIIPFILFYFSLSGHLLLVDHLCYKYA